ncbi:MAG TPA: hypothetical protein DCM87_15960 [Planctomycetes bacterium]|nr:hypothetical protein [Planctomycetota bacterium]
MRKTVLWLSLVVCAPGLFAAYDSALAPYPWRKSGFDPRVEELLGKLETRAAKCAGFSATVTWAADPGVALDLDRQKYGPLSLKSGLNWHLPNGAGFWPQGAVTIEAVGRTFAIHKAEDESSPADWWYREGEHIYARAWSVDWPTVWRFHHDALEADILAYCEGLGLLFWAADPGEYLRRGDRLAIGEDRLVNGKAMKTLVATPAWIASPLFLENRTTFPFNHSTMLSWAVYRPVVTYFIDPESDTIAGAEFVYHDCLRDNPKDWTTVARPSGLAVTCLAESVAELDGGVLFPTRITGEVTADGKVLRRTVFQMAFGPAPAAVAAAPLPADKRMIDPWPFYRSEVFVEMTARGEVNYANLLGLARAFAFEKRVTEARNCLLQTVAEIEADTTLSNDTGGGIDWELGFALHEYFRWAPDADIAALWNNLPATALWRAIVTRGLELYRRFEPAAKERIEALQDLFNQTFLEGIVVERTVLLLEIRKADLLWRAEQAEAAGLTTRADELRAQAESVAASLR